MWSCFDRRARAAAGAIEAQHRAREKASAGPAQQSRANAVSSALRLVAKLADRAAASRGFRGRRGRLPTFDIGTSGRTLQNAVVILGTTSAFAQIAPDPCLRVSTEAMHEPLSLDHNNNALQDERCST
jgi:hypothetical protein